MKYELTNETKRGNRGVTLHRIKAIDGIPGIVRPGERGGWVQSEKNLSQKGNCWVADNAIVSGEGFVGDNAYVNNSACVWDRGQVLHNSNVGLNTHITERAKVCGGSIVRGDIVVKGAVHIWDNAVITGRGTLDDFATIAGSASITGKFLIFNNSVISEKALVVNSTISGKSYISGHTAIKNSILVDVKVSNGEIINDVVKYTDVLFFTDGDNKVTITPYQLVANGITQMWRNYEDQGLRDEIENDFCKRVITMGYTMLKENGSGHF